MQALQRPEKDSLRLGTHLLRDKGIVFSLRVFLPYRQDDLPPEEPHAAVIEGLERPVAQRQKADVQISLIALPPFLLQIHRKLGCDNGLDVVGLGQRLQLHVIVHHQKLMLQIRAGKGACLHLGDAAGVHVVSQQRAKHQPDAALALATLAGEDQHLLSLGGGDKAVPHELLQGGNVLRLQKLGQKMQPFLRLRRVGLIGYRQTVPAEVFFF